VSRPQLSIIKIGGKIISDKPLLSIFFDSFKKIEGPKILIHGGGRKATEIAALLGIKTKMHEGRRITTAETLEVVTMVYAGLINKNIVSAMQAKGIEAIGLSGADGNLIEAVKRPVKEIDFGFVGNVVHVNTKLLHTLIQADFVPVVCPLTHSNKGQLLNTNADTITNKIAEAMSQDFDVRVRYCFEYNGVLRDMKDPDSIITQVTPDLAKHFIADGTFTDGMLPKLQNAFEALHNGAKYVSICGIEQVHELQPGTQIVIP